MKESNKLIAEFLIGTWNLDNLNMQCNTAYDLFSVTELGDVFADTEGDNPNAKHFFTPDEMEFHTSWDWLRPVVEEIHTHGCEIVISSNGVTTIYSDKGKVLVEEDSEADDHMHDATYKAVVTYIKNNKFGSD